MSHLDEGQLLALRDDPALAAEATVAHVETCTECRGTLEAIRGRASAVAEALDALDTGGWDIEGARERVRLRVSERAGAATTATTAVAAVPVAAVPATPLPARRARRVAWSLSRAAGLLLITAAGLSALPGSPVRRWIERMVSPAAVESAPPAPEPAAVAEPVAPEEAGIRLPLTGGPLDVVLRGAAPGTEIRVTWVPGSEAALFAPVGSRFTSGEGRMEADLASGPVRVELPRGVVPVILEVNGRLFLRNTAAGLDVSGPVAERAEAGITFRLPPG